MDEASRATNHGTVDALGLFEASFVDYGRLSFRTLELPIAEIRESLLNDWAGDEYGPSWRFRDVVECLERHPDQARKVPVILMEDAGNVRLRKWDMETGFVNLFQGRDNIRTASGPSYPGDRMIGGIEDDPSSVVVQVHRVARRDAPATELLTLAVHLGDSQIVRKGTSA